jgi:hypothetical protein
MPTLPDRATSILAVLEQERATASEPISFDWRSLVEAKKPGAKSESQQRQAMRFKGIYGELAAWAERYGISREHLEESACYGTVCTDFETPQGRAVALAKTICWIYQLDDFLDRQDVARLACAPDEARATLDIALGAVFRPLTRVLPPETLGGLGFSLGGTEKTLDPRLAKDAAILRGALISLLRDLAGEWARLPWALMRQRTRRALVAEQLVECAAAMRREILWSIGFARVARDGAEAAALPSFAVYLQNGAVSIGMPAVAAVAASFEERPRHAWRIALATMLAGGNVVRLTNDLHTYFADVDEGKVSSVTLRLAELGLPPSGLDPDASAEVRAAQTSIERDLAQSVSAFAYGQEGLPVGPLAYCVRHAVAFALAVYGDGSRFRREQPAVAA